MEDDHLRPKLKSSSVAVPEVYPLSTVRLENGIGLRLNLVWEKPHDGDGKIPGYWEESSAGTGIALTTAATAKSLLAQ